MKKLWIIGNAVQDVTVELDLEQLARYNANLGDSIQLGEGLEMKSGLVLKTQFGQQEYAVLMKPLESTLEDSLLLRPGDKYMLESPVFDSFSAIPAHKTSAFVHCESVSWGGGGVNAARYIRSLARDPKQVPIVYADVAMTNALDQQVKLELSGNGNVVDTLAKYSGDKYLEVYLASLAVEPALYRPKVPQFRLNWVFCRVWGSEREINNKIICRGNTSLITEGADGDIFALLNSRRDEVGLIQLNSVSSRELFEAAYKVYKSTGAVGVFALTDRMQAVADALVGDLRNGTLGTQPCILVFNEKEVVNFSKRFGYDGEPFMKSDEDIPNLTRFGQIGKAILGSLRRDSDVRVYVTAGPRGSLGVDSTGNAIYVSSFAKPKAVIIDVNTCGDAYCGTVALLEWAKRVNPNLELGSPGEGPASEMMYFMAVATATAYCRATSRRGSVDWNDVDDLLQHSYLARTELGDLIHVVGTGRSRFTDGYGRLKFLDTAKNVEIKPGLMQLVSPQ